MSQNLIISEETISDKILLYPKSKSNVRQRFSNALWD